MLPRVDREYTRSNISLSFLVNGWYILYTLFEKYDHLKNILHLQVSLCDSLCENWHFHEHSCNCSKVKQLPVLSGRRDIHCKNGEIPPPEYRRAFPYICSFQRKCAMFLWWNNLFQQQNLLISWRTWGRTKITYLYHKVFPWCFSGTERSVNFGRLHIWT